MKFDLTPEEFSLINNSEWLLAKHRITDKVYQLFGELNEDYKKIIAAYQQKLPTEIFTVSPKIYKGEKYRMLPYVMMDQPRFFSADDAFAVRSFFWWGNHFSIHLLLGGKFKKKYEERVLSKISDTKTWYVGISKEPWEHHFETDNYMPLNDFQEKLFSPTENNYLKLGKWLPLSEWQHSQTFFLESYSQLLETLSGT